MRASLSHKAALAGLAVGLLTIGCSSDDGTIDRAIKVNGCTGCPELHPLVVCALPGDQHGGHDGVVNPGFATFVKQFSAGNFLTQ